MRSGRLQEGRCWGLPICSPGATSDSLVGDNCAESATWSAAAARFTARANIRFVLGEAGVAGFLSASGKQVEDSLHVVVRVELDLHTATIFLPNDVDFSPKDLAQPGFNVENIGVFPGIRLG